MQDDLIARLAEKEIDLQEAIVELTSIKRRKPLYPQWVKVSNYIFFLLLF